MPGKNITFEVITDGNIEVCRDLCNELMVFQKTKATIAQESFDGMNFDTRMKRSFENAFASHTAVVKDNGLAIGYVFSTIDCVEESDRNACPDWAPVKGLSKVQGFFPEWVKLPAKIGCLSNLYFKDSYRGMGLGSKLFDMALEWLESFKEVPLNMIYISNGNDAAYDFYINRGFSFSHDVFGGFIKAVYKIKK